MEKHDYIVIGGGMAGGRAAENARKADDRGSILLLTKEPYAPYERPPLSKGYLRGVEDLSHVYLRDDSFYPDNRIEVRTDTRVTEVLPEDKQVRLTDGTALGYDKLMLATGSSSRRLPIPGVDLANVHCLRTIADSDAIRAADKGRRVVVLGGSFTGSEVAASLAQIGADVTVAYPEDRLQARVTTPDLGAYLDRLYADKGVRLLPGTTAVAVEGDGRAERVVLSDGQTLPADLVVVGAGSLINTDLARKAGLKLDRQGAVLVDDRLRTSDPDIYAGGDIAAWPDRTFEKRMRVEHWDVARGQGIRAGRNMAGEDKPYVSVPYLYSDLFQLYMEAWGDLTSWDVGVHRGVVDEGHFVYFYFRDGRLVAALGDHLTREEQKAIPAIVRRRPAYADVADRLTDVEVPLADLAE